MKSKRLTPLHVRLSQIFPPVRVFGRTSLPFPKTIITRLREWHRWHDGANPPNCPPKRQASKNFQSKVFDMQGNRVFLSQFTVFRVFKPLRYDVMILYDPNRGDRMVRPLYSHPSTVFLFAWTGVHRAFEGEPCAVWLRGNNLSEIQFSEDAVLKELEAQRKKNPEWFRPTWLMPKSDSHARVKSRVRFLRSRDAHIKKRMGLRTSRFSTRTLGKVRRRAIKSNPKQSNPEQYRKQGRSIRRRTSGHYALLTTKFNPEQARLEVRRKEARQRQADLEARQEARRKARELQDQEGRSNRGSRNSRNPTSHRDSP